MKRLFFVTASVTMFALMSCKKHTVNKVTFVKDCTGSYLRIDGKDYHVCNIEKTNSFANGAIVTTSYKKISKCTGSGADQIACMMLHENEGWIEVMSIR
ncbi:MAG: hypothetical protein WC716_05795 [Chitinophagaceae bacterium]|jgi:hypothetical protein